MLKKVKFKRLIAKVDHYRQFWVLNPAYDPFSFHFDLRYVEGFLDIRKIKFRVSNVNSMSKRPIQGD